MGFVSAFVFVFVEEGVKFRIGVKKNFLLYLIIHYNNGYAI